MEEVLKVERSKEEIVAEILELKAKAEAAIRAFKQCLDHINAHGYMVKVQTDNSVFIFKDVRESYGTLIDVPPVVTKEPVNGQPNVKG